jgi:hypothetical protein
LEAEIGHIEPQIGVNWKKPCNVSGTGIFPIKNHFRHKGSKILLFHLRECASISAWIIPNVAALPEKPFLAR